MKILISGGTGFLGTNLYQWVRRNHPEIEVSIASRRTGTDIRDFEQVKKVIKGQDYVIHCAAQTHVDYSLHNDLEDQLNFVDTNVKGTLHVIKACQKYGVKMIHISSSEVYGSSQTQGVPMTEVHSLGAQAGIYATTKACADLTCRMETITNGANIVILRPFNFWGPGQSMEKFIPRLIDQGMNKQPLTIYGDGLQKRDYLYIHDACEAIWKVLEVFPTGEIYNIATSTPVTILSVAKIIADYFHVPIIHVEPRPGEVRELCGDYTKIKSLTGWEPSKLITKDSLTNLIGWYKENGLIIQPVL